MTVGITCAVIASLLAYGDAILTLWFITWYKDGYDSYDE